MGDGRAKGWSAIGDGGRAAMSLLPGADGTLAHINPSSKLEGLCVGDLTVCRGSPRAAQGNEGKLGPGG